MWFLAAQVVFIVFCCLDFVWLIDSVHLIDYVARHVSCGFTVAFLCLILFSFHIRWGGRHEGWTLTGVDHNDQSRFLFLVQGPYSSDVATARDCLYQNRVWWISTNKPISHLFRNLYSLVRRSFCLSACVFIVLCLSVGLSVCILFWVSVIRMIARK